MKGVGHWNVSGQGTSDLTKGKTPQNKCPRWGGGRVREQETGFWLLPQLCHLSGNKSYTVLGFNKKRKRMYFTLHKPSSEGIITISYRWLDANDLLGSEGGTSHVALSWMGFFLEWSAHSNPKEQFLTHNHTCPPHQGSVKFSTFSESFLPSFTNYLRATRCCKHWT